MIFLFLFLVALDAVAKAAALEYIPPLSPKGDGYPFGGIPIFQFSEVSFSLNRIGNTGAAWGLFQGHSALLFAFRCAIIGVLIVYLLFFNRGKHAALPLWLIAAGALGNAIDYGLYGYVVDFFHFCFYGKSFPIFNVADMCITLGAFLLLVSPKKSRHSVDRS